MQKARLRLKAFVLSMISAFMAPGIVAAANYEGCFTCEYTSVTGIGAECNQVEDGQYGEGWQCSETNDLPWPNGPSCKTSGGICYFIRVNAGGGGGGGGGGDTCERGAGGVCPAECFSCGGSGGGGLGGYI